MPLERIPALQANQNLRRRHSLWPDGRVPTDRLQGVAKVALSSGFYISPDDRIMTIGSCFAREIERRLSSQGFDIPMLKLQLPAGERYSSSPNDLVNKYTIQSIVNEFAWAFGETLPPDDQFFYLRAGRDLWHAPQLIHNLEPASLERVRERRGLVAHAFRELPSCRVTVVTLGLAEAWWDEQAGVYLNGPPPAVALKQAPDRFSLDVLSYEEILWGLEAMHGLIRRHGHPDAKILITVSPVPFKATFTGVDAIQANSYSKAVQRAAVEAFVRAHDNVDYFPSYEIVSLSHREVAFKQDNIHVTASTVAEIMDRVMACYCPELALPQIATAKPEASKRGREGKAELKRTAKFLAAERDYAPANAAYHLDYGVCLLRSGRPVDGVCELRKASALRPADDRTFFKLGIGLGRLKMLDLSIDAFRRATELSPDTAHYQARLGLSYRFNGRDDLALRCYRRAYSLDPKNVEALAALAALEGKVQSPASSSV